MSFRKINFANGEFYHIYNRGVEKRPIFSDSYDLQRFLQSMEEFNSTEPIGSIFENSFKKLGSEASKLKLVNFVAYCLNPNHFHFVLEQVSEKGIEKFMHRLGTGYTKYFNNKQKRTGALFQGVFKSKHVNSNEYLLHLSVYVNLNNDPKLLGSEASKLSKSSWSEYLSENNFGKENLCKKEIILGQFKTLKEYEEFARSSLDDIIRTKEKEFDFD
ncbi:MAG: transposase [Candidatus Paceibacterota bacterium]|jgi:REP element-mobilizing transposase RayT